MVLKIVLFITVKGLVLKHLQRDVESLAALMVCVLLSMVVAYFSYSGLLELYQPDRLVGRVKRLLLARFSS